MRREWWEGSKEDERGGRRREKEGKVWVEGPPFMDPRYAPGVI